MNSEIDLQIGLANIGNTCFFNTVLQALRLCPAIGELFLSIEKPLTIREESKCKQLVLAFQILMRDFWKEMPPAGSKPTLIPRGFFQSLFTVLNETNNGWYTRGEQADAQETVQYILESIHDGLYQKVNMRVIGNSSNCEEVSQIKAIESWASSFEKEYSPIIQNFYGQTQICIRCEQCKTVSERYEPWMILKVPIPGGNVQGGPVPNLDNCVEAAFANDSIDDFHCNTCSNENAKKNGVMTPIKGKAIITNRISRLPPVVILSIKRFTNEGHKVRGKIDWNLDTIDLSPVMAFSRNPFNDMDLPKYETYAVIEHHGSLQGGHYTMYAKQNNEWLEYDDNSITNVTPDRVVSADSYIMFLLPKEKSLQMNVNFAKIVKSYRNFYNSNNATKSSS